MSVTAISEARWQEAQRYEHDYWEREKCDPVKLQRDIADGHHFTMGVLDIRPDALYDKTVLDIAGGPYPLVGLKNLPLLRRAMVDPASYDTLPWQIEHAREMAEEYTGGTFSEVWGYNVLQHVRDPEKVMATARRCAVYRIRWFDVIETQIYPVHPHSIKADWLRAQLSIDGFRIVRDIDGSRLVEGHRQKWVALVAQRSA